MIHYAVTGFHIPSIFKIYVRPAFYVCFLIIAVASYIYIFRKYMLSRRAVNPAAPNAQSVFQNFRTSRFYISAFLILTFLLIVVLPNIVAVAFRFQRPHMFVVFAEVYQISFLCDGYIYVFLHLPVNRLLRRKLYSINFFRTRLFNNVHPEMNVQEMVVHQGIIGGLVAMAVLRRISV